MTIREATEKWVDSFSHIPLGVVKKLAAYDDFEVTEITPVTAGDIETDEYSLYTGRVVQIKKAGYLPLCISGLGQGLSGNSKLEEISLIFQQESEPDPEEFLPMWGTMWAFGEQIDNNWLEDPENLKAMAECGFRIYEQEDYGYIFGVDGAGYDFYEHHWIPLYKARGIRWHDEDE